VYPITTDDTVIFSRRGLVSKSQSFLNSWTRSFSDSYGIRLENW